MSSISKMENVLILKSVSSNIAKVEPYVNQLSEYYGFGEDLYGNILISLTEAVTNAILHGNCGDASKNVTVEAIKESDHLLCFKIKDEGCGFDHENVPDPTCPENIMKLGGRGVFLIRQLALKAVYEDSGSTLLIQFSFIS